MRFSSNSKTINGTQKNQLSKSGNCFNFLVDKFGHVSSNNSFSSEIHSPVSSKCKKFKKDSVKQKFSKNLIESPTSPKGIAKIPAGGGKGKASGIVRPLGLISGRRGDKVPGLKRPESLESITNVQNGSCSRLHIPVEKKCQTLSEDSAGNPLNCHSPDQSTSKENTVSCFAKLHTGGGKGKVSGDLRPLSLFSGGRDCIRDSSCSYKNTLSEDSAGNLLNCHPPDQSTSKENTVSCFAKLHTGGGKGKVSGDLRPLSLFSGGKDGIRDSSCSYKNTLSKYLKGFFNDHTYYKKDKLKNAKKTAMPILYAMPESSKLLKNLKSIKIMMPHPRLQLSDLNSIVQIANLPF